MNRDAIETGVQMAYEHMEYVGDPGVIASDTMDTFTAVGEPCTFTYDELVEAIMLANDYRLAGVSYIDCINILIEKMC